MTTTFAEAARAFEETLEELGLPKGYSREADQEALGRRAALLAVAETLWTEHLGVVLEAAQVMELLGVRTRQAVHDLARRGRLLALPGPNGRPVYPAFQFGPAGRPYKAMAAILREFAPAAVQPHTLASWFKSPQGLLEGETPASWLEVGRDEERVIEAARRTAARLSR